MSFSGLATPQGRRNTILASVAVASLGVAGVLGGNALSPTHPAYAAAVSTADLPQNAPSFAPLIDRVKASVVSVKVKIAATTATRREPLRARWTIFPRRSRSSSSSSAAMPNGGGMPEGRHPMMMGEGSGFFVSADGYIVTNNHVVDHAKTVTVTTLDGKTLDAKVVGTDPKTDLALIKVERGRRLSLRRVLQGAAPHRRLGRGDRQPLRPWRHGDRGHRLGRRPRHRRWPL